MKQKEFVVFRSQEGSEHGQICTGGQSSRLVRVLVFNEDNGRVVAVGDSDDVIVSTDRVLAAARVHTHTLKAGQVVVPWPNALDFAWEEVWPEEVCLYRLIEEGATTLTEATKRHIELAAGAPASFAVLAENPIRAAVLSSARVLQIRSCGKIIFPREYNVSA